MLAFKILIRNWNTGYDHKMFFFFYRVLPVRGSERHVLETRYCIGSNAGNQSYGEMPNADVERKTRNTGFFFLSSY